MEREVEGYIHSLSDVDLLAYTRNKTHLPEALEFARVELADRHFTPDYLATLEGQLRQREKQRQKVAQAVASEPLNSEWRFAIFLCGVYFGFPLLFFIPAWLKFRKEGAHRKIKDMLVFTLAGLCLLPILALLRIPPWSWLAKLF